MLLDDTSKYSRKISAKVNPLKAVVVCYFPVLFSMNLPSLVTRRTDK